MARFMRKGITKIWFVPSIASATLAPTAAEVAAGIDLSPELAEINGFSFANQPIDTPDMVSTFTPKIPGEDQVDDSSMTFYEEDDDNPIYDALEKGTDGFVVIFLTGIADTTGPTYTPAAADVADVWPVIVGSRTRQYTADNEAAKYMVSFTPSAVPGGDLAVLS